jgi:hypothetical protein
MVLLVLCLACSGSGLNTATGTVTYKGAPAKGAMIIFHPKDPNINSQRPTAVTDESGSYTLTTGKKDGGLAGDYVVTITWPEEPPAAAKGKISDGNMGDLIDRLKGRYGNPTTSKLTAVIKSGSNTIPTIDLQ